ncbi:MAG: YicC family protein [Methylococcaceae bacterium]|nr:YicC family protein [Methylococcaceae bacterium]
MIRSMTAFAANESEQTNLALSCELRSVNHRYLDITIKMPDRLRFAESEIRSIISAKISRGKLECSLNIKKQSGRQNFFVDPDIVSALIVATEQIERQMGSALSFSALDVLAFPGVQQEPELDKTGLSQALLTLVSATIAQLTETREREGAQLKALIEERCVKIQAQIAFAKQRIPEVMTSLRKRLTDRITEIAIQPDFDRLEQELVYLAQKLDITEELDRLETHVTEVLRVMNQSEPVGRRLDFLMQELNREANTLGSKSTDKDMTQISIELKVLIEQIREQVQNIE